jgi:hypothetical protein
VQACALALAGRPAEDVLAALARAIQLEPAIRARLAGEPDLVRLRDDPRFVDLVGRAPR